jgi:hypothetical protein
MQVNKIPVAADSSCQLQQHMQQQAGKDRPGRKAADASVPGCLDCLLVHKLLPLTATITKLECW